MVLILSVTFLLFYAIISLIIYNENLSLLQSEVKQEARYIRTAINISGPAYLEEMDEVDVRTRVTRIDQDGNVLYDSRRDASSLENHGERKEVKDALANGTGEDIRLSYTVGN